jgi:hypothetical protein
MDIGDMAVQLMKRLEDAGFDCSRDENTVYFAGNYMLKKGPISNLSGEVEVRLEKDQLVFSYKLSFIGQTIFFFTLVICGILLFFDPFGKLLLAGSLFFIAGIWMGVNTFRTLLDGVWQSIK